MNLNGENEFFYGRVAAGDGEALVFINMGTLPALVEGLELHMDATFHSAPRRYYQLASLHVIAVNTVIA